MMPDSDARSLEEEIGFARREISSDSYPMSIGELTNLYREAELVISPAFQRLFRWSDDQKSHLVESILLGIPLPSIFVAQNEDGTWELVDGLQRVSTILELQGLLKKDGVVLPQLTLHATKYLPSLEGKLWESDDPAVSLSAAQRLDVKRAKIDIKIIKRSSSDATKFDLFQRLNSYGSPLTPQEMRGALLVSVNQNFYEWLVQLTSHASFVESLALSDRLLQEQYDHELALRFLILHARQDVGARGLRSFTQLVDDESQRLAAEHPSSAQRLERNFKRTFDVINDTAGADAFRRWDVQRGAFVGGFLNTAYEVIAMGLGYHVATNSPHRRDVAAAARQLWERPDMTARFATGLPTETRLARMLPIGRELMAAESSPSQPASP